MSGGDGLSIVITAFTEKGTALALELAHGLEDCSVWTYPKFQRTGVNLYQALSQWVREQFEQKNDIIFISAAGIAVRSIAPYVGDKLTDPAVVSVDEQGRFAVPL